MGRWGGGLTDTLLVDVCVDVLPALNVVPSTRIAIDHQIDMTGMNNSILAADNEGTGTEFLWGFLMGLLLGVFMLLMVRADVSTTVSLSRCGDRMAHGLTLCA